MVRLLLVSLLCFSGQLRAQTARIIREFDVPLAHQAVAVDSRFFYVINSSSITRHDKQDGKLTGTFDGKAMGIVHLNSGILLKGKLYCANSNFPQSPMSSSIEIFDPKTMRHIGTRSLGIDPHGSLTWVDFHNNSWWCGFAHYSGKNAQEGKDNRYTTLVRYDKNWQKQEAWAFPDTVIRAFGTYSNSGGVWTSANELLCTGHDAPELYVMALPENGYTLRHVRTIPAPGLQGQGIAVDKSSGQRIRVYGILRARKKVTVSEITP